MILANTIQANLLCCLLVFTASSEPISSWHLKHELITSNLAPRADVNWTTQAFQTHCDNINFNTLSSCCTTMSGPGWLSCNEIGNWQLGSSTILCYSLDAGHDCCNDDEVCDSGLGCCGDKCCQNSTSVTVCGDGCVSKNGFGCVAGMYGGVSTCAHGVSTGGSSSSVVSTTSTIVKNGVTSTIVESAGTPTKSATESTGTAAPVKSGLSTGSIIGIAVSIGCSVIGLLVGVVFRYLSYTKKQKREEQKLAQAQAELGTTRTNSFPSAPVSPAPQPPYQYDREYSPFWGQNQQRG